TTEWRPAKQRSIRHGRGIGCRIGALCRSCRLTRRAAAAGVFRDVVDELPLVVAGAIAVDLDPILLHLARHARHSAPDRLTRGLLWKRCAGVVRRPWRPVGRQRIPEWTGRRHLTLLRSEPIQSARSRARQDLI